MKFDYIIGNPPYVRELHLKISNRMVDIAEDDGQFLFIQPATAFYNKNSKPSQTLQKYKESLKIYHTKVKIVPGGVFDASFATDLSITTLTKTLTKSTLIEEIEYKDGGKYNHPNLEDISMCQIHPEIFASIRHKTLKLIKQNGSLKDITKPGEGVKVAEALRGTMIGDRMTENVFSFYSPIDYKKGFHNSKGKVILCKEEESENIYDYLEKLMPKMALLLYKYSLQTQNFIHVPVVDFSRTYSNQELFDMVGFTENEISWIKAAIPEYSARLGKEKVKLSPFYFKKPSNV